MTMEPAWRILDPNSPQPVRDRQLAINRRQFFGRGATGIGTAALAGLLKLLQPGSPIEIEKSRW